MPLDNTASIKDIITSLQSMEGINAKADLASVVGSPAQDTDTMATIIGHIQVAKNELAMKMNGDAKGTDPLQKLIGELAIGKKWALGTFTHVDQQQGHTITGLGFRPSVVVGYDTSGYITGRAGGFFAYYGLVSAVKIGGQSTFSTDRIHTSSNGFYIDDIRYDAIVPMSFHWIAIE